MKKIRLAIVVTALAIVPLLIRKKDLPHAERNIADGPGSA
jgi:hypothetical protein